MFSAGISALLVVALEGVRDPAPLQMVEFGRGFGYKLPLSIGMPSVGSTILKQIVSHSYHISCNRILQRNSSFEASSDANCRKENLRVNLSQMHHSGAI